VGSRVALVGCGRWGVHVLRDLAQLGCEVVVIARSDATRERAEEGGAAAMVASSAELPGSTAPWCFGGGAETSSAAVEARTT
jgi:D-arabinose 1-dehydrogenase-like Zn-dependent alcohol dehydrogenase